MGLVKTQATHFVDTRSLGPGKIRAISIYCKKPGTADSHHKPALALGTSLKDINGLQRHIFQSGLVKGISAIPRRAILLVLQVLGQHLCRKIQLPDIQVRTLR